MNKICTSIEQSKKLVELGLDIKTADMYFDKTTKLLYPSVSGSIPIDWTIPAWSLSALLGLMPELDGRNPSLNRIINTDKWWIMYHCTATLSLIRIKACDNPLDAAFEMVCWLLENKKI